MRTLVLALICCVPLLSCSRRHPAEEAEARAAAEQARTDEAVETNRLSPCVIESVGVVTTPRGEYYKMETDRGPVFVAFWDNDENYLVGDTIWVKHGGSHF